MADQLFFENTKTKKRYRVVRMAEDGSSVTLKGEFGEFTEPYSKERFKSLGYKLVREEGEKEDTNG